MSPDTGQIAKVAEPHELAEQHCTHLVEHLREQREHALKEREALAEEMSITEQKFSRRRNALEQSIGMCDAALNTQEKELARDPVATPMPG